MMTETSRADKHDEDVMVQLMFELLCPLEDKACPRVVVVVVVRRLSRIANCWRQLRQGPAGLIRRGRNDHRQSKGDGDNGTGDTQVTTTPTHTTTRVQ